jgi:hypothetical protein
MIMDRFFNLQEKNQTLYEICTRFAKMFDRKTLKVSVHKPTSSNSSLRININNEISLSVPYDFEFTKKGVVYNTPENKILLSTLKGVYSGYTLNFYSHLFQKIEIVDNTDVDQVFEEILAGFKSLSLSEQVKKSLTK